MASELGTIRALYRYNSRVRKRYLRAIWTLPVKERYRDRGASFPSLVDIFLHVLDDYRYWFRAVYASELGVPEFPLGQRLSLAKARQEERIVDRMVKRMVDHLTPADLRRILTTPRGRRLTLREMLLHMFEEEIQHRGELNALLWQMDVDPPVLGYEDALGR